MTTTSESLGIVERRLWIVVACFAIAAGIYLRLTGIWKWPFATDEYYIYRSIAFVTESGLPAFPCGGFYVRGLVYQYLAAPLIYLGLSPETVVRSLSALGGLAVLPAAGMLAFRLGGIRVAACVVAVLSLSVWEIEMSRFGRMYTFFQAVFIWYAYHAYCLIRGGDHQRWRWLLGLSVLGPLVWEGGILLSFSNFVLIAIDRRHWRPSLLASATGLLAANLAFLSTNFRFLGTEQDVAVQYVTQGSGFSKQLAAVLPIPALDALQSTSGMVLLVAALVVLAFLLFRCWRIHRHVQPVLALSGVCLSLIGGQLLLASLLLVGAMLVGWVSLTDLRSRDYRAVILGAATVAGAWIAFAVRTVLSEGSIEPFKVLISFPELLYSLMYPWLATLPLMAVFVAIGTGLLLVLVLLDKHSDLGTRGLLAIAIVAITIIGGAQTLYEETRYSFHLYPLVLVLAVVGLRSVIHEFTASRAWLAVAPGLTAVVFLASADFDARHLSSIDSYAANFRIGYENRLARHYFPRFDFASPAAFVNERRSPGDSLIVTNVVLTRYLLSADYMYMNTADPRFVGQVCAQGQKERWTNLPLLAERSSVESVVSESERRTVWLVADWQTLESTLPPAYLIVDLGFERVFTSHDERLSVFRRQGSVAR